MSIYIGIDPGVNTGFAVWDSESRTFIDIRTCGIVAAMEIVGYYTQALRLDGRVVFEDARRRKWLPQERNLSEYRGKLMGAGSVKRDCDIWEEFCKRYEIPYTVIPPAAGRTKWDADYFAKVTGWTGRTSNHARDAALLVWGK